MRKRTTSLAFSALAAAASFGVHASDFSYSYVEAGYTQARLEGAKISGQDIKPQGGYLAGSVALGNQFNVFGSYGQGSDDERVVSTYYGTGYSLGVHDPDHEQVVVDLDYDFRRAELGVGHHAPISATADWVTELAAINMRLTAKAATHGFSSGSTANTNGARLGSGVRFAMGRHFEGTATVGYMSMGGDVDYDGFIATLGVQAKINKTWGVTSRIDYMNGMQVVGVGVRASF